MQFEEFAEFDRIVAAEAKAPPAPASTVAIKPDFAAWGVTVNSSKKLVPNLANAVQILKNAHPLASKLRYDDFSGRVVWCDKAVDDGKILETTQWLQASFHSKFSESIAYSAINLLAREQRFDSLVDHVSKPVWDLVPRVDSFFTTYLGVEASPYVAAVGRVLLLSLAARALFPGCKVDTVPVIEGNQGARKSTSLEILGGEFFVELAAQEFGSRDCAEQVGGTWVVEIGELQGLSRAETNAIKGFISRKSDRYRRPYARTVSEEPRRCVMVGTTNASEYLRDETGARRWMPVRIPDGVQVDTDALTRDRDQLIAEAVSRVRGGEPWHLVTVAEREAQDEATADRFQVDEWENTLCGYLHNTTQITIADALGRLGFEPQRMDRVSQMRCASCLVRLGFQRRNLCMPNGVRRWTYCRP